MLTHIRNTSKNIFVKILLSIVALALILSLGDFFKSNSNYIAKIGSSTYITLDEMNSAKVKFKHIADKLGEEQYKALNIDSLILKKIIDKKLIELEAKNQKIKISNQTILEYIKTDPMFFDNDKKFDKEKFKNILKSNNISEKLYLDLIKTELASKYLMSLILERNISFPNTAKVFYSFVNQERIVDIAELDINNLTLNENLSKLEIEDYYKNNQDDFTNEEKRSIDYIKFNSDILTKNINITEDDINEEYEQNKEHYIPEESRDIYNIILKTREEAENAREKLLNEKNFDNYKQFIIKDIKINNLENAWQEEAFHLKINQVSDIIESPFGYHIIIVDKIHQANIPNIEQIRPKLVKAIKEREADKLLYKMVNDINDEIASGASLNDISAKFHLSINHIEEATRSSILLNPDISMFKNISNQIFSNDNEHISELINEDNNYLLYNIDKIIQQEPSKIELVENQILNKLLYQKREKKARELMEKILPELEEKKDFSTLPSNITLKEASYKYSLYDKYSNDIRREFFEDIFSREEQKFTKIHSRPGYLAFAYIKKINLPKLDNDVLKQIENELSNDLLNILGEEYINYLHKKYKVKIYN